MLGGRNHEQIRERRTGWQAAMSLDASDGPPHIHGRSSHDLPNLSAGQPLGSALGSEILAAIVDTGAFLGPRSREE